MMWHVAAEHPLAVRSPAAPALAAALAAGPRSSPGGPNDQDADQQMSRGAAFSAIDLVAEAGGRLRQPDAQKKPKQIITETQN